MLSNPGALLDDVFFSASLIRSFVGGCCSAFFFFFFFFKDARVSESDPRRKKEKRCHPIPITINPYPNYKARISSKRKFCLSLSRLFRRGPCGDPSTVDYFNNLH